MALTDASFTTSDTAAKLNGVKMLVHGFAGLGKTLLVPTLPKPVLISAESGLLSLQKKNIEKVHGQGNPSITYDIPTILIRTLDDLKHARSICSGPQGDAFLSVALDSITEIADVCLATQKLLHNDGRQAYGELATVMDEELRAWRDLPGKNVYMACKMEYAKDEGTGIWRYVPMMPGAQLSKKIPYLFDEVFAYRMGTDQQQRQFRYLQTQPDLQYEAKDRSGTLDFMEFPHLGAIINKIKA